ncbi:MAG: hypothetical protein BZ151_04250, partial [Desulfobacca sp. 4484_104]
FNPRQIQGFNNLICLGNLTLVKTLGTMGNLKGGEPMTKGCWKWLFCLAIVLVMGVTSDAWSWTQKFQENGMGITESFDKIEVFMISEDDVFQDPGIQNFSASSWSAELINPQYVLAAGPTTTYTEYTFVFPDPKSNPFQMDYLVYAASELEFAQRITWNGKGWKYPFINDDHGSTINCGIIKDPDWNPDNYDRSPSASVVPLPGALFLLGAGVFRLAVFRRRKQL